MTKGCRSERTVLSGRRAVLRTKRYRVADQKKMTERRSERASRHSLPAICARRSEKGSALVASRKNAEHSRQGPRAGRAASARTKRRQLRA